MRRAASGAPSERRWSSGVRGCSTILNALYASKSQSPNPKSQTPVRAQVALVGAGPGDPELWTQRAVAYLEQADLVLYDALVDAGALRRFTKAQCFCVGKRAGRESVRQETIHRLMIRAAAPGQACCSARRAATRSCSAAAPRRRSRWRWPAFAFEVVPGVSSAIAAPELAGIPVTHRGSASGFLVLSGHATDAFENGLQGRSAQSAVSLVVLMGLGSRHELAETLMARGWNGATPAAIVCGASTPDEWVWTGTIAELGANEPPAGIAGVVVVGDVVSRSRTARCSTEEAEGDVWPQSMTHGHSGVHAWILRASTTSTSSWRRCGSSRAAKCPPTSGGASASCAALTASVQDGVQMLRVKAPQGIVSSSQMRAFAGRRVALLARLLPHHHAPEHPVSFRPAEERRSRRCASSPTRG